MYWVVDWTGEPLGKVVLDEKIGDSTLKVFERVEFDGDDYLELRFDTYLAFPGFPEQMVGYTKWVYYPDEDDLDKLHAEVRLRAAVFKQQFIANHRTVRSKRVAAAS